MAAYSTVLIKPNPLLLRNRRTISESDGNFCSIRSCAVFCASSKLFATLKCKSFAMISAASSKGSFTSMSSKKDTAVPFNHITTTTSSCYLKENHTEKDGSLNNVLKFIMEWLRIPVVLLMLFMTTYGRRSSALAFSGGAMGGYSFSSSSSDSSSGWHSSRSYICAEYPRHDKDSVVAVVVFFIALFVVVGWIMYMLQDKTRVFKLQVGLLVDGQSLQKDLKRIAKTTDSSSEAGWGHMLEETISSLQRHDKYWISGSSYVTMEYNEEKNAEEHFKKLSSKERKKFSEETLVNLDDMEKERITRTQANNQFSSTYMVVTIVMAASKLSNLESHIPTIFHHEDVKKALNELLRINNTSRIQGLHILWTPQKENEVLSLKEFQENYPSLKVLFQSVPAQVLGNGDRADISQPSDCSI